MHRLMGLNGWMRSKRQEYIELPCLEAFEDRQPASSSHAQLSEVSESAENFSMILRNPTAHLPHRGGARLGSVAITLCDLSSSSCAHTLRSTLTSLQENYVSMHRMCTVAPPSAPVGRQLPLSQVSAARGCLTPWQNFSGPQHACDPLHFLP